MTVTFKSTMGGLEVLVDGRHFGDIGKGRPKSEAFFVDSTTIRQFMTVSPADLRAIADKVEDPSRT